jgi:broad specificity phosphatase PhoE
MPPYLHLLLVLLSSRLATAMPTNDASPLTQKTVFLIRHAESEENRRLSSLGRCFKTLGKFSLPSKSDIYASTELLNVMAQIDSNVSQVGAEQIADMAAKLKEANFLKESGVQLVAHSPLLRAQETSEGMLGCRADKAKAETVGRVVELDLLIEKTPQEWTPLYFSTFKQRIANFENWLGEQAEDNIAIVGHSQFFKAMLGLDFKFGNCDVWQVMFDLSQREDPELDPVQKQTADSDAVAHRSGLPPQWSDLKQVFACEVKSTSQKD